MGCICPSGVCHWEVSAASLPPSLPPEPPHSPGLLHDSISIDDAVDILLQCSAKAHPLEGGGRPALCMLPLFKTRLNTANTKITGTGGHSDEVGAAVVQWLALLVVAAKEAEMPEAMDFPTSPAARILRENVIYVTTALASGSAAPMMAAHRNVETCIQGISAFMQQRADREVPNSRSLISSLAVALSVAAAGLHLHPAGVPAQLSGQGPQGQHRLCQACCLPPRPAAHNTMCAAGRLSSTRRCASPRAQH